MQVVAVELEPRDSAVGETLVTDHLALNAAHDPVHSAVVAVGHSVIETAGFEALVREKRTATACTSICAECNFFYWKEFSGAGHILVKPMIGCFGVRRRGRTIREMTSGVSGGVTLPEGVRAAGSVIVQTSHPA